MRGMTALLGALGEDVRADTPLVAGGGTSCTGPYEVYDGAVVVVEGGYMVGSG